MQHDNPWHTTESKIAYQDEWVTLMRDEAIRPEGTPGSYTYIDAKDSVLTIAVNNESHIYMEWTYRYPTKTWGWELPGGGVGDKEPLEAAKSELSEEMGYEAKNWVKVGITDVYNGLVTAAVHVFVATEITPTAHSDADDSEITNTGRFFSISEIEAMIASGSLKDTQAIAAFYMYQLSMTS